MSINVTLTDKDKKLIQQIEQYQHPAEMLSFVAAVRKLCDNALGLKKSSK